MAENVFADDFEAARVSVERSAVRQINAAVVGMKQSAVQRLSAETLNAEGSAFGVTNAATAELRQSAVGVLAGDYVKVDDSRVFLLLAPRVSGNVRAVLTLPAAFAFGAGYFLARRIAKAMFGRSDS